MTEHELLALSGSVVAALFGCLCAIIGYIGASVLRKMDKLVETLNKISNELHERISGVDRRLTRVETRVDDHIKLSGQ